MKYIFPSLAEKNKRKHMHRVNTLSSVLVNPFTGVSFKFKLMYINVQLLVKIGLQ